MEKMMREVMDKMLREKTERQLRDLLANYEQRLADSGHDLEEATRKQLEDKIVQLRYKCQNPDRAWSWGILHPTVPSKPIPRWKE